MRIATRASASWRRIRLAAALVSLGAVAALILASASGAVIASAASTLVPVAGDPNPALLPGVSAFGDTPASTPEIVSIVLREQNLAQLEANVEQGLRGSLTVSQFAATYGQSAANIAALQAYLGHFGITTQVDPGNVDVIANGTAGQFDAALAVTQYQFHVPARRGAPGMRAIPAQSFHGAIGPPQLPPSLAQFVLAILGLTNYGPYTNEATHTDTALLRPQTHNANACVAATGLAGDCRLPSDFGTQYGLAPLYAHGASGQGQTIGILTLASLDPGAPQYFWSHVQGLPPANRGVSTVDVDGGAGPANGDDGSVETDLDVEQAGGIAPNSNVVVYQAPNTDGGFVDVFFAAASQDIASADSISWVDSETDIAGSTASGAKSPGYVTAVDEALLEMAAQGQSMFVGTGDWAAYDAFSDIGTTNLSIENPADSPFITATGGTTLPLNGTLTGPTGITAPISVAAQRAWGWDYLWPAAATTEQEPLATIAESLAWVGGTGGGFSVFEPQPSYQRGLPGTTVFSAVPYLTPSAYQQVEGLTEPTAWSFNPTPPLVHGAGSGRAIPDLSANADPYSGYTVYCTSCPADGGTALSSGWGGTSFDGPQFAASAALIDGSLGRRVGLWTPWLYAFAASRNSPFTPLQTPGTTNDNLYYTGTPGLPYNPATGLGVPNLSVLAADFAAQH